MKKNLHSGGSCGEDRCHLDYNHYDSIRSFHYLDNLSVMNILLYDDVRTIYGKTSVPKIK